MTNDQMHAWLIRYAPVVNRYRSPTRRKWFANAVELAKRYGMDSDDLIACVMISAGVA